MLEKHVFACLGGVALCAFVYKTDWLFLCAFVYGRGRREREQALLTPHQLFVTYRLN